MVFTLFVNAPIRLRKTSFQNSSLNRGLANYGLWAKSRPLPVFINKVLLELKGTNVCLPKNVLFGILILSWLLKNKSKEEPLTFPIS